MPRLLPSAQPDLFAPAVTPAGDPADENPGTRQRAADSRWEFSTGVAVSPPYHRRRDRRFGLRPLFEPGGLVPGDDHDHGRPHDGGHGGAGGRIVRLPRHAASAMAWQRAGIVPAVQSLLRSAYGGVPGPAVRTAAHAAVCSGELHADAIMLPAAAYLVPRRLSAVARTTHAAPLPPVRRGHRSGLLRGAATGWSTDAPRPASPPSRPAPQPRR